MNKEIDHVIVIEIGNVMSEASRGEHEDANEAVWDLMLELFRVIAVRRDTLARGGYRNDELAEYLHHACDDLEVKMNAVEAFCHAGGTDMYEFAWLFGSLVRAIQEDRDWIHNHDAIVIAEKFIKNSKTDPEMTEKIKRVEKRRKAGEKRDAALVKEGISRATYYRHKEK